MRIPSCLQRLSGNRSADREGEGCTGDTDIFLTSKGTYGRFFDAASMQTSSVLHHDGSLVETKGRGGGGKEGGRGFTQLRHESTFKEREFRLKPRCNTRVPSALYGPRSPAEGRGPKAFPEIDRTGKKLPRAKNGEGPSIKKRRKRRKHRGEGFLDGGTLGRLEPRTRDGEKRPVGTETRASSKFDIISNNVCLHSSTRV